MNPVLLIAKKRDGGELSADEITFFINGYSGGSIPDYQMSALAMAIFLRGMTVGETAALTAAMLASGSILQWPKGPPCVDKHSTGGIGDKTSLILAPLLACCGVRVPMISGRGLGATGGTLDKLEAIRGFRTDLTTAEIQKVVNDVGCVITGASAELAPADKKLYGLRDVTATVASIPLITASIMSKKLAEGLNALVLDVKFGSGAFMKTLPLARELAHSLANTGRKMGVATTAILSDMNQPLGRMAGNAIEVDESLDTLRGEGPADVRELTLELCVDTLVSAGVCQDRADARATVEAKLDSGAAYERFEQMVAAQGGDLSAPRPRAPEKMLLAGKSGYVAAMDTEALGIAVIEKGGGRTKAGEPIDHAVGFEMLVRIGDEVTPDRPLARLFVRAPQAESAARRIAEAITISNSPPPPLPLIVERL